MPEKLEGVRINLFHTAKREQDAKEIANKLIELNAVVNIMKVEDNASSRACAGKVYYFKSSIREKNIAKALVETIRDIEPASPLLCEISNPGISCSIWMVGLKPKRKLAPEPEVETRRFESCSKCGASVLAENLDRHLASVHANAGKKGARKDRKSWPSGPVPLSDPAHSHLYRSMSPQYGNDFRLCVCEGSNENCRYCYGSGKISGKQLSEQTLRSSQPRVSKRLSIVKQPLVCLPKLEPDPYINNKRLQETSSAIRKPLSTTYNSKITHTQSADPAWTLCKKCMVHVKTERLNEHLKREHQIKSATPKKVSSVPQTTQPFNRMRGLEELKRTSSSLSKHSSGNTLIKCPYCSAQVKSQRLDKHLRKVHRGVSSRSREVEIKPVTRPKAKYPSVGDLKTGMFNDSFKDSQIERSLDHTRLYAHAYREAGRFGSHPSHDGFDDESSP